jgi:hypothetical protein
MVIEYDFSLAIVADLLTDFSPQTISELKTTRDDSVLTISHSLLWARVQNMFFPKQAFELQTNPIKIAQLNGRNIEMIVQL